MRKPLIVIMVLCSFGVYAQDIEPDVRDHFTLNDLVNTVNEGPRPSPDQPLYYDVFLRDSALFERYSLEEGHWQNDHRTYYYHNEIGQYSKEVTERYSQDAQDWVNDHQLRYSYNSEGYLSAETSSVWDAEQLEWDNSARTLYTYDNQGQTQSMTQQVWDTSGGNWQYSSRSIYEYNEEGDSIVVEHQSWDEDESDWNTQSIEENEFDEDGDLTESVELLFDTESREWVRNERTSFYYNVEELLQGTIVETWETEAEEWKDSQSSEILYNGQGLPSTIRTSTYSGDSTWQNETQQAVSYDSEGNLVESVLQNWRPELESWVNIERRKQFWQNVEITREPRKLDAVDCRFLNPMPPGSQITCFNIPEGIYTVRIFDEHGRIYFEDEFHSGEPFTMPSLNRQGLFFFQIIGKRVNHAERIVVKPSR